MNEKHVINIAGTVCSPAFDRDFNKWYDQKHIPDNMEFKGLQSVTRYRLVRFTDTAAVKRYPQYMTPYRFKDLATFNNWNSSPELAKASVGAVDLFKKWGVELLWRVQFESMQSWQETPPTSVVTMVATSCRPDAEKDFNEWYSGKHVPDLLKFKGLQGVTRYQLASTSGLAISSPTPSSLTTGYPRFLTFYYFKNKADNDAYDNSPERTSTLGEAKEMNAKCGLAVVWRAQYEPMRTWQR